MIPIKRTCVRTQESSVPSHPPAAERIRPDEQQRQRILALAADFPRLWNDPATPHRERKRIARLLIEDVTLTNGEDEWTAGVRLRGGATRTLTVPPALPSRKLYETPRETVAEIDRLLDDHTEFKIAVLLNDRGNRSGHGLDFDPPD